MKFIQYIVEEEYFKNSRLSFINVFIELNFIGKVIPNVIVDDGNVVNVMPLTTIGEFGLLVLIIIYQVWGSKNIHNFLTICTRGEEYKLTFVVVCTIFKGFVVWLSLSLPKFAAYFLPIEHAFQTNMEVGQNILPRFMTFNMLWVCINVFTLKCCGSLNFHGSPEWHPNRIIIRVIPWDG